MDELRWCAVLEYACDMHCCRERDVSREGKGRVIKDPSKTIVSSI